MKSFKNEDTKSSKKEEGKVSKLSDLKRMIGHIINEVNDRDFPKVIHFNRGIEFPKYKVTIEEIDEDFFVDSKGSKWVKVKDDTMNND